MPSSVWAQIFHTPSIQFYSIPVLKVLLTPLLWFRVQHQFHFYIPGIEHSYSATKSSLNLHTGPLSGSKVKDDNVAFYPYRVMYHHQKTVWNRRDQEDL